MATVIGSGAAASEQIAREYDLLRSGAGLIDRSERGRLALTGSGAAEFLNGQVTNEIAALAPGLGCYAAFLTHKGKMLGDLRVLAVGEDGAVCELLLETERVALQTLFDMIRRFKIGFDVELHKRTLETSLLSLIGPSARDVATAAVQPCRDQAGGAVSGSDVLPPAEEHAHRSAEIGGAAVRLISTAAPDGLDVLCGASDRDAVEQALLAAGAARASEQAAEILRVEHGRPRYGIDLDDGVIPQEAGLNERAVSFTKGCYVGQETVARLYYRGKPNRRLRGLLLTRAAPPGEPLLLGDREVGVLSSSALSPRLGAIGLAIVRREAEPGATLAVGPGGVEATLVELPLAS
ncbi:MAG: CAF17-like 4Fe-4S cluster assembly/insertion protein YgfZ [Solirubrobacteraceae bacterium]